MLCYVYILILLLNILSIKGNKDECSYIDKENMQSTYTCYNFFSDPLSYDEAAGSCDNISSWLTSVRNPDEDKLVSSIVKDANIDQAYIGGTVKYRQFIWEYSKKSLHFQGCSKLKNVNYTESLIIVRTKYDCITHCINTCDGKVCLEEGMALWNPTKKKCRCTSNYQYIVRHNCQRVNIFEMYTLNQVTTRDSWNGDSVDGMENGGCIYLKRKLTNESESKLYYQVGECNGKFQSNINIFYICQYIDFEGDTNTKYCTKNSDFCISIHKMFTHTSWQYARHECLQMQANLLEIPTREIEDFVYEHGKFEQISNSTKSIFWIGAKNYDLFWSNNDKVHYVNFQSDADFINNKERLCLSKFDTHTTWTKVDCNEKMPFICSKNIKAVKKDIVEPFDLKYLHKIIKENKILIICIMLFILFWSLFIHFGFAKEEKVIPAFMAEPINSNLSFYNQSSNTCCSQTIRTLHPNFTSVDKLATFRSDVSVDHLSEEIYTSDHNEETKPPDDKEAVCLASRMNFAECKEEPVDLEKFQEMTLNNQLEEDMILVGYGANSQRRSSARFAGPLLKMNNKHSTPAISDPRLNPNVKTGSIRSQSLIERPLSPNNQNGQSRKASICSSIIRPDKSSIYSFDSRMPITNKAKFRNSNDKRMSSRTQESEYRTSNDLESSLLAFHNLKNKPLLKNESSVLILDIIRYVDKDAPNLSNQSKDENKKRNVDERKASKITNEHAKKNKIQKSPYNSTYQSIENENDDSKLINKERMNSIVKSKKKRKISKMKNSIFENNIGKEESNNTKSDNDILANKTIDTQMSDNKRSFENNKIPRISIKKGTMNDR